MSSNGRPPDGEEALRVFGANTEAIDLLLTGVVLPGKVRGREVAERVQTIRPELQVVFMSAYTENSTVHHGRLDDEVRLIGKPFKREQLARKVVEVLDTDLDGDGKAGDADGKVVELHPRTKT